MPDNQNIGHELGWDGTVENDSTYELLPEGEYAFEVLSFERGRFNGSDKLPPCNSATYIIKVSGTAGEAVLKHTLFLHSVTEGLLCSFFVAIGLRKHGEKFNLAGKFEAAIGKRGRCKVHIDTWTGRDSVEHKSNKIKYFLDPEEAVISAAASIPDPVKKPAQWKAGKL